MSRVQVAYTMEKEGFHLTLVSHMAYTASLVKQIVIQHHRTRFSKNLMWLMCVYVVTQQLTDGS